MKFAYLQEPPFCFTDATGKLGGCDAVLAEKVCQVLKSEDFSSIETEFAELLPGLVDGRWDTTTGLFISEERSKLVDFTRPIWSLPDGLMVAKGNPLELNGYRSVAQHPSAVLAVISDQIQHQTALRNGVPPRRIRIIRHAGRGRRSRRGRPHRRLCQRRHGASRLCQQPARRVARCDRCAGFRTAARRGRFRSRQGQ